ncbi:MAG: type III-B CRISPR module RAMP protein Cmr1 [Thermofilaceae archaeon]|nr:type III-B CRISPR module RAMP protein Cmr1 [Thermofilaceae archaeon]MDW8004129.1 type III-B CRISPR module RAMP protein Cmr1 [Thermofilaceae archaeon]
MSPHTISLYVSNVTPLLTGWYDPQTADPMGLRATEIKGLWRWWARAFIAGALYERNMLKGSSSGDILKRPTKTESELISSLVGKKMGLGYAGERGSEQSRFTIRIEPLRVSTPVPSRQLSKFTNWREFTNWQRLKLLSLGGGSPECILPGAEFKISVTLTRGRFGDAESLAFRVLLITLQLCGVGKAARRGFGSLDLTRIVGYDDIPNSLHDLLDETYALTSSLVERETHQPSRGLDHDELPPMACVSKAIVKDVPVSSIYEISSGSSAPSPTGNPGSFPTGGNIREWSLIHNFFVRMGRCRVIHGSPSCFDQIRKSYAAWFLGLPREQRDTGYKSSVDRRASPIFVAFHSRRNIFGNRAFMSILLSSDWPQKIHWKDSGGPRGINVNKSQIVNDYNVCFNELSTYLKNVNLGLSRVWP